MSLRRGDWIVTPVGLAVAQQMVERLHYARGGSNTSVYCFGLFRRGQPLRCLGVTWWLPPTRVAAESVDDDWQGVLSLTRMVLEEEVPRNGASFLLAASVKRIRADGRFHTLVTYADESQGHTGGVYRASNWEYIGRTGPYQRWLAPDGRQVATKATVNRTKAEMEALGHRVEGTYYKHKFVLRLARRARPQQLGLLEAAS